MSTLSALNRAILAGQRLEACNNALHAYNASYLAARGSSMSQELIDALTNAERALLAHQSVLRDQLEAARIEAAQTRVFQWGAYFFDLPHGYTACTIKEDGHYRIAVHRDQAELGSAGKVYTVEKNGDDVGGFVVEICGVMAAQVFGAEHAAIRFIFEALRLLDEVE